MVEKYTNQRSRYWDRGVASVHFLLFALTYLYDEIPQIYLLIGTVGAGYLFYIGLVGCRNNSHESITIKDSINKRLDILKSFWGVICKSPEC